jgi:DNA polymerase-3 subunit alpha
MRDLLRRMQPTLFDDIVAVGALYRPGPMGKNAHNDYADRKTIGRRSSRSTRSSKSH